MSLERRLAVFDPANVYLSTKKIDKNNPKEEIKADNAAWQEWNRTADMAVMIRVWGESSA